MEWCTFIPSVCGTPVYKRSGEALTLDDPVPDSHLSKGLLDTIVTKSDVRISYHQASEVMNQLGWW